MDPLNGGSARPKTMIVQNARTTLGPHRRNVAGLIVIAHHMIAATTAKAMAMYRR
jgi:hypothetical protein